ncbi:MAG TPA: hypothetical protein GX746_02850 [Bacteroidales bacterium]|nr:hypothetical protein [Bacteroidales bacterium]
MFQNNLIYLLLVIAVDLFAIYHLFKRVGCSIEQKIMWTLVILLLPLIGVAVFYMWLTFSQKNRGQSRRQRPWDK